MVITAKIRESGCVHWVQVILPLLKSDLFSILMKCVSGDLSQSDVVFSLDRAAVGVVLASSGYPASYQTGFTITGQYLVHIGTGIRGLMRGMATLLQFNQELLVVRDSWKTPGELGVSKSMECDIFPSVL